MPCLTLLGVSSIQEFLFRSNRLRENLGASGLVRCAMQEWVDHPDKIYVGGGNAALRFPDQARAREQVRAWSERMLRMAPGLRLIVAHREYQENHLPRAFLDAQRLLAEEENRPPLGAELGALPIVRACPSTGLAASERDVAILRRDPTSEKDVEDPDPTDELGPGTWLSAEAYAKRRYFWEDVRPDLSRRYFFALKTEERRYLFPRDLLLLGTVEGASQVALVHADGNGIGGLIDDLIVDHLDTNGDEQFLAKISALSANITLLAENAFKGLIQDVVANIPAFEREETLKLRQHKDGPYYLPLRPIVDDGDDLTFVCHGRLGLSLAVRYLELFEQEAKKVLSPRRATACAGVLVMPQKFPFAQGYRLAAELCAAAKQRRRETRSEDAWLDFHVQMEGRAGDIEFIRARQYPRWGDDPVLRRPYCLGKSQPPWTNFEESWTELSRWPRSVAKRLYQAYSAGAPEVTRMLQILGSYKEKPYKLPAGLSGKDAFDALEFLDFHAPWPEA
jgi:hypothetical protein